MSIELKKNLLSEEYNNKIYDWMHNNEYLDDEKILNANLAATILKIQERKTNKGKPYAVIKFSDLYSVKIFSQSALNLE